MEIIWHATASIELRCEQGRLLFDPFVPLKGAEFPVPIEIYDGFTDILVTHGHFDHILFLPQILHRNPGVRIHCTQTPYRTLLARGVPERSLQLITAGESFTLNGFEVTALPGRHAVLPKATLRRIAMILTEGPAGNLPLILRENRRCPENGETLFYHITCGGSSVSLMGSLNLRPDVAYPTESDVLILPYNGWEDNFPPAVEVIERLKPRRVLLDHYDNAFPPVTSPVDRGPILRQYAGRIAELRPGECVEVS